MPAVLVAKTTAKQNLLLWLWP